MEYYYLKNNFRYGPVNFENLKSKEIKKDTLVWYEGLKDWTKAEEIKELKELFKVTPPPTPPPPIPPAPKKEFKTPTPPPLPKTKIIDKGVKGEIKEPKTSPPLIVQKEKTLSPPPIRNNTSSNENFGKRPIIILIICIISFIFIPIVGYAFTLQKEVLISNYGLWFYIAVWLTLIINLSAFVLILLMYRIGPILYVISQSASIIYSLIAGMQLETVTNTTLFTIIFSVIMFSYYKRMK